MISTPLALAAICTMSVITIVLRATPFLASSLIKDRPIVANLGRFLPAAIMALLVIHSLYSSGAAGIAFPWQAVTAALFVIAVQLVLRRPLISIVFGTGLYMALLNMTGGA